MADKKDNANIIPDTVREAVEGIARGIGVAATELWSIFVRQYVVKGLSEVFTAIILAAAAVFLYDTIGLWSLIPGAVAVAFVYGAIAYLGNPKYYALTDITKKVEEFTDKKKESSRY